MEKQIKQTCCSSMDRLSTLPDDVICHILSFLPTKYSVATSALARRWRSLWAHVPNLDFSTSQFHCHRIKETDTTHISDVIHQVMSLHESPTINSFSFTHEHDCSDDDLEEWIDNVTDLNVSKIYILLDYQVSLPSCLFTCETLVDLELCYCYEIPMTGDVCLPALKKLRLEKVKFESNESLPHLLSGCPVLEELIIEIERLEITLDSSDVSSTTLTRLEISSEFEDFEDCPCEVDLDTPALRYLSLYHVVPGNVSDRALTSLNEAEVNFDAMMTFRIPLYYSYVLEFVGRLSNVKSLRLSTGWMNHVNDSEFSGLSTKFNNLTKLVLDEADWRYISYFLENADNLEVLAIICIIEEDPKNWVDPKQVPTCVTSHLRSVSICQFGCTEPDFNMVRYLLWNAKVMKRMVIRPPYDRSDLKEKFEELKKISLSERGSEAIKLTIH